MTFIAAPMNEDDPLQSLLGCRIAPSLCAKISVLPCNLGVL
jgi:hypothetical protein